MDELQQLCTKKTPCLTCETDITSIKCQHSLWFSNISHFDSHTRKQFKRLKMNLINNKLCDQLFKINHTYQYVSI